METKFKIGDRVYDSVKQEWGCVRAITHNPVFPISVQLDEGTLVTYTKDGRRFKYDKSPRLHHEEMVLVPKRTQPRVIEVFVHQKWMPRVFIKQFKDGSVLVWAHSETIEEAEEHAAALRYCKWRELTEKTRLTKAEFAEKFGVDFDTIEITD